MQQNSHNPTKQFVLSVFDYMLELLRKWYVYLILGLLFCGFMYFYLQSKESTYQARLTFMTNTNNSGGLSSLMRLAGSFGLGGKSSGDVSAEKLAEIITSERIMKTALFTPLSIVIDGSEQTDLLINHFYNIYPPENFEAQKLEKKEKYSLNENALINKVIRDLRDLLGVSTSDNGIVKVFATTTNEGLSQAICVEMFTALDEYYAEKSIEKQQETYDLFKTRTDSLSGLLMAKEGELKAWLNKYAMRIKANSLTPDEYMNKVRLERETEMVSNIYKEALQSTELASMELDSAKPLIQIIDAPVLPLKELYAVPFIFYGLAIFAALVIGTILIVFNKIVRDALRDE